MGVMVSSSHIVSAAPSSSGGGLLTLPLLQREGSSHGRQFSINFSNVIPSHRLQLFTICSSMGPSHGVTSPASKPALAWALSTGPQVLTGASSSMGFLQGHSLLRVHPPAPVWSSPWAAGGDLLYRGPPWAAGGQPGPPWSSSQAAGENSLLWHLEHLLHLLFTNLGVCRVVSLSHSHSSL